MSKSLRLRSIVLISAGLFAMSSGTAEAATPSPTVTISYAKSSSCILQSCSFKLKSVTFDSRVNVQMVYIEGDGKVYESSRGSLLYSRTVRKTSTTENRFLWTAIPTSQQNLCYNAKLYSVFSKSGYSAGRSTSKSFCVPKA